MNRLCWAYYLGWSEENLRALALHGYRPFLGSAEETEADRLGYAQYCIDEAKERVDGGYRFRATDKPSSPSTPTLKAPDRIEYLQSCLALATAHNWQGRTGPSDSAVYKAVCLLGLSGKPPRLASPAAVRTLEEFTGFTKDTCAAALRRLVSAGYLRLTAKSAQRSFKAAFFLPVWPILGPSSRHGLLPREGQVTMSRLRTLAWMDLGRACQKLIETLESVEIGGRPRPTSDAEWYVLAGVSRSSFKRLKPTILEHGLAVRHADGWHVATDLDLRLQEVVCQGDAVSRYATRKAQAVVARIGHRAMLLQAGNLDVLFVPMVDGRYVDRSTGELVGASDVFTDANQVRARTLEMASWVQSFEAVPA